MIVYIVIREIYDFSKYQDDSRDIVGVFDSREKAEDYIQKIGSNFSDENLSVYYVIEEFVVK